MGSIQSKDLRNPVEERLRREREELLAFLERQGNLSDHSRPQIFHRRLADGRLSPYTVGQGRRKTAIASVRLSPAGTLEHLEEGGPTGRALPPRSGGPGVGMVVVNGEPMSRAFRGVLEREHVLRPFQVGGDLSSGSL